jgi:hypothetical protein
MLGLVQEVVQGMSFPLVRAGNRPSLTLNSANRRVQAVRQAIIIDRSSNGSDVFRVAKERRFAPRKATFGK